MGLQELADAMERGEPLWAWSTRQGEWVNVNVMECCCQRHDMFGNPCPGCPIHSRNSKREEE